MMKKAVVLASLLVSTSVGAVTAEPLFLEDGYIYDFVLPPTCEDPETTIELAIEEYTTDIKFPNEVYWRSLWEHERLNSVDLDFTTDGKLVAVNVTEQDVRNYWNRFWVQYESQTSQENALYEIDKIKSLYDGPTVECEIVTRIVGEQLSYHEIKVSPQELEALVNNAVIHYVETKEHDDILCFD